MPRIVLIALIALALGGALPGQARIRDIADI